MALKAETKEKLKSVFGFDVDKLIEAVKADAETDYPLPDDVTVMKTADLEVRDSNNKAAGKTEGESAGEKKGKELAAKAFRKKFALEDSLGADVDKVVEAVNAKLNKGDAGLQEQILLLQKDKERLEAEKGEADKRAKAASFDADLIGNFPANRSADMSDVERLALVKMNLSFEEVDGKTVVKKGGEIVRDKNTQAPLSVKDVINSLFTERKWVVDGTPPAGGRGGGDNPPNGGGAAGLKKASQFREKWKAENPGIDENGREFQAAIAKHTKDMPDFDWYN